jgi:hypothetical protein
MALQHVVCDWGLGVFSKLVTPFPPPTEANILKINYFCFDCACLIYVW